MGEKSPAGAGVEHPKCPTVVLLTTVVHSMARGRPLDILKIYAPFPMEPHRSDR